MSPILQKPPQTIDFKNSPKGHGHTMPPSQSLNSGVLMTKQILKLYALEFTPLQKCDFFLICIKFYKNTSMQNLEIMHNLRLLNDVSHF